MWQLLLQKLKKCSPFCAPIQLKQILCRHFQNVCLGGKWCIGLDAPENYWFSASTCLRGTSLRGSEGTTQLGTILSVPFGIRTKQASMQTCKPSEMPAWIALGKKHKPKKLLVLKRTRTKKVGTKTWQNYSLVRKQWWVGGEHQTCSENQKRRLKWRNWCEQCNM